MNTQEKEIVKNQINFITQKMTRGDIAHLLMYFFETQKLPEVIMLNRGNYFVEGFAKLSKHIFKFEFLFFENNNKVELRMKIKTNRSVLEKREIVELKQKENELAIYLSETKQYLLSVYF